DYTLDDLSSFLSQVSRVDRPSNAKYYSWIFDTHRPYYLAATSIGEVLANKSAVEGCLQSVLDASSVLFLDLPAENHSNPVISLMSKEVIYVHGISKLQVNGSSDSVAVPIDYPAVVAGRVQYMDGGNGTINWVVVTAVSVTDLTKSVSDDQMITFLIAVVIIATFLYFLQMLSQSITVPERTEQKAERSANDIRDDIAPVIRAAATSVWDTYLQQFEGAVTMTKVKEFLSRRAVNHILAKEADDKMLLFDECQMESDKNWKQLEITRWFQMRIYHFWIQTIILAYFLLGFF
ncbi:hypothetical protein RFI_12346, partial [Reticulomyxa filosa]